MPASSYFYDVQKLYLGYYGRAADAEGLAYWASRVEQNNGDMNSIINEFANSSEANTLYGGLNNLARIEKIYQLVFQRAPDSAGASYYAEKLDDGTYTPGTLVFAIIQGALAKDLTGLTSDLDIAMNNLDQNLLNTYLEKFKPASDWTVSYTSNNYGGLTLDGTILKSSDGFGATLDANEKLALTQLDNFNVQKTAVAYLGRDILKVLQNPDQEWRNNEASSNQKGGVHVKIGQYETDLSLQEYASFVLLAHANQFAGAWYPLEQREKTGQNVADSEWLAVLDQIDDPILQLVGQYGLAHDQLLAD